MPTLLAKPSRAFLAPARKPRPVFLPLKTALPTRRRRGFSRQSEGRHNTLYFAVGKVFGRGHPCTPNAATPRLKLSLVRQFQKERRALDEERTRAENKKRATTDFTRRGIFVVGGFVPVIVL